MFHPFSSHSQCRQSLTTKQSITMPSVSDELAALRTAGTVRQQASALKSKSGVLSTPEAEEAFITKGKKEERSQKAKAEELLRKTNATRGLVDVELKKVGDRKREFERGRSEAKDILSRGVKSNAGKSNDKSDVKPFVVSPEKEKEQASNESSPVAKMPKKEETEAALTNEKVTDATKAKEVIVAPVPVSDGPVYPVTNEEVTNATEAKKESVTSVPVPIEQPVNPVANEDKTQTTQAIDTKQPPKPQDENNDDQVPDLEETNEPAAPTATNRNEKKVRKIMSRLDMRPVPSILRATMKTPGGNFFVIDNPDVFASKSNTTHVIFGEARQMHQPQQMRNAEEAVGALKKSEIAATTEVVHGVEVEEQDEEGLEQKDIDLVMAQASCERGVAVKALRENDGDLVNAIMSLTT